MIDFTVFWHDYKHDRHGRVLVSGGSNPAELVAAVLELTVELDCTVHAARAFPDNSMSLEIELDDPTQTAKGEIPTTGGSDGRSET